jgi:serine/threonine protein kinase
MDAILGAALGLLLLLWAGVRRRGRRAGGSYELVRTLGLGDLSEVHEAVRDGARYVLKIPRVRGLDDRAEREREVLRDLRARAEDRVYARYLPEPVEAFPLEGRRVSVFSWRDGFRSAEEIRERFPRGLDGRHVAWMFNRTLEILGFAHRAGWVHGAVLPPHLLFHPDDHALLLCGWIHAERAGSPLRLVPSRYAEWYPPDVRDRAPAEPSVDVSLAARTMLWLGGDALPVHLRRFFRGCDRCPDAWRLRKEFGTVLEDLYGPPSFHPLVLK